jgi:serine/threonine protein phosphatase 1
MESRTLAIGDIHGCQRALETLLNVLAVSSSDTLVFVGNAVDRDPASKQVLDRILTLQDTCDVVFIMGNHEQMMRDGIGGRGLLSQWLEAGGQSTLDSYGGTIDDIPPEHIRFLLEALPYRESETDIFVHACLEPHVSMANQTGDYLRWKHLGGSERPHRSGKRVICGKSGLTTGWRWPISVESCVRTD